jgi:transposase InsO family protein
LRIQIVELIREAEARGARREKACGILGVSARTFERWTLTPTDTDKRRGPNQAPENKLTADEEAQVIALVNQPKYRNLSPEQVVAKAADNDIYVASERTIRRILEREKMAKYRERSRPATVAKPREFIADGPLQVLTWDITYLRHSQIRGGYFYLYLFVDIWSRRIVGAEVYDIQSADLAADLLAKVGHEHGIKADGTALHSDNGAPMKAATMLATMQALGIVKSFSCPGVSDDNPFIEALFRHLKYAPTYPTKGFGSLDETRDWVKRFVDWYNREHLHSSIAYVTPEQRHDGRDIAILENRRRVYEAARSANPSRWSRHSRQWHRPAVVMLNPDRTIETSKRVASVAA